MNRRIVYIGQVGQDTDILLSNKFAMISDGWIAQAVLGTGTQFSGFACTPTSPASMQINIAPGAAFSLQNVDNSPYGSLAADTNDQIVKIGIVLAQQQFTLAAPTTVGNSVVYLIEAAFEEVDNGSTVLPYYNAANPASPFAGPNNTGVSQNTVRQDTCLVQVKAGVSAPTGTQVTPAPDAGFTGLWAVTIANGQTTIVSGNIVAVGGAPFITETLGQKISQATGDARYAQITSVQNNSYSYAIDGSGAANTITANMTPALTAYVAGQTFLIKIANTNTGPAVGNLNTLGNKSITLRGNPLVGGELIAGQISEFVYDGTNLSLLSTGNFGSSRISLNANTTFYVATTGNDTTGNGTSGNPWATIQHAALYVANSIDIAGFVCTIQVADGTYTSGISINSPFVGGAPVLQGNLSTPSNCIINITSGTQPNITVGGNAVLTIGGGFKLISSATSVNLVQAGIGAHITINGPMEYGSATNSSAQIIATDLGIITINGNYTISGGAEFHFDAANAGQIINGNGSAATVTLTGTPAFANFANAIALGYIGMPNQTYSGSATGQRYAASQEAIISTNGGGANYFPGSTAGNATGGLYV